MRVFGELAEDPELTIIDGLLGEGGRGSALAITTMPLKLPEPILIFISYSSFKCKIIQKMQ